MQAIKQGIYRFVTKLGYQVARTDTQFSNQEMQLYRKVKEFTATGPERVAAMANATRYVVENKIPGAIVECGVWRGGSIMAGLLTLLELGDTSREVYLFDTFEGMPAPSKKDRMFDGQLASDLLGAATKSDKAPNDWCYASTEDVLQNVSSTGYPMKRVHLIKGMVEQTIPHDAPDQIALLRLDTDWYESTAHELKHLYPRLANRGIMIIDDYGHWQGARMAVDEFIQAQDFKPFLHRIDYTGRLIVKPQS